MNLFKCSKNRKITQANPLICTTPLGDVLFQFGFNNKERADQPNLKNVTDGNAFIFKWNFQECEVEFFRADFLPKIPSSLKIDYCSAGIWRVKSLSPNLHLNFKTVLQQKLKAETLTSFETGEGLFSCLYENGTTQLSIGTEDEEYLVSRAYTEDWMPKRLETPFLNSTVVQSNSEGIQVVVPPLEVNEELQIQFILAWSSEASSNSSTWFAVDQKASFILNQFNVF